MGNIAEEIETRAPKVIAIECYSGVYTEEINTSLQELLKPELIINTIQAMKPESEILRWYSRL